ncbi:MAG: hypothetical protein HY647_03235 [Acidobacteria bacterium]|nr:hypothetical protein [Acidobacteriota bacterium]
MTNLYIRIFSIVLLLHSVSLVAQTVGPRTTFHVTYVAKGAVYLDGGHSDGLAVGMNLTIKRVPEGGPTLGAQGLGEIEIVAVASMSAVGETESENLEVRVGDIAVLSLRDADELRRRVSSEESRKYAQVVTFTEEDPLEEELRASVPRPPLPEINRVKGSVSFQYSTILDRGGVGSRSSQQGVAVRADMTRLGGSYWNFTGYWRGRRTSRSSQRRPETLSDLLNRTYHIGFRYNNPDSPNIVGFGRLLLPWASSLSTIDGGYFARRLGGSSTFGVFGGSTPDPTAWNFDPDRKILGVFSNLEKGSFDSVRYVGTFGVAQSRLHGKPERHFGFFENNLFFNRLLSVYHNTEVDYQSNGDVEGGSGRLMLTRSFLTFRVQPHERLSFDLNHSYFQNTPTSDPRLVGTGLLDQIVFSGINGGIRWRVVRPVTLYASVGRSERKDDAIPSWNYLYGITLDRLPWTDLRVDLRTSRFNSSFGSGRYHSLSVVRTINEAVRFEFSAGQQHFRSALSSQTRTRWMNFTFDWYLGTHYLLGGGGTIYRGDVQNYDQWFFSVGCRF